MQMMHIASLLVAVAISIASADAAQHEGTEIAALKNASVACTPDDAICLRRCTTFAIFVNDTSRSLWFVPDNVEGCSCYTLEGVYNTPNDTVVQGE